MGIAVVTGIFVIAGVLIGTLLEPVKLLITSRARTRQLRGERCASFIQAAHSAKHGVVQLNSVHRARHAKAFTPASDQVNAYIESVNKAKDELRRDAALLRLYGPDKLANQANLVVDADARMFELSSERDEGEYQIAVIPPKLKAAVEAVDKAVEDFAKLARRSIR